VAGAIGIVASGVAVGRGVAVTVGRGVNVAVDGGVNVGNAVGGDVGVCAGGEVGEAARGAVVAVGGLPNVSENSIRYASLSCLPIMAKMQS
jgi:hypothetical protein